MAPPTWTAVPPEEPIEGALLVLMPVLEETPVPDHPTEPVLDGPLNATDAAWW